MAQIGQSIRTVRETARIPKTQKSKSLKKKKKGKKRTKKTRRRKLEENKKKTRRPTKKAKKRKSKNSDKSSQKSGRADSCPDLNCINNVGTAMKIEKDQISNFIKQKSRIESYLKLTKAKMGKKGVFEEDAASLKSALGGDLSNASCGASTTRTVSAAAAVGRTLSNCSARIKAACPEQEMNSTVQGKCLTAVMVGHFWRG